MEEKAKEEIRDLIRELNKTLITKPVDYQLLEQLFQEKRYAKLISEMKNHMGIGCRISVKCIARKQLGNTAAWVLVPEQFPTSNSYWYKNLTIDLFFHKEATNYYYAFINMIAHELSHIVLGGLNHRLRNNERAVDITALILGFGKYYELGHTTFRGAERRQLGYLSYEELCFALSVIESEPPRNNKAPKKPWFSDLLRY